MMPKMGDFIEQKEILNVECKNFEKLMFIYSFVF